ncbi:hypothetical protein ACOI1H_23720 [Loktanella sp. DJP18]|uniref:hypothetical protein n=1 Tax=Loktanella sp. DJP18 TaxID=3409788 RepID=UPI003BB507A8
MFNKMLSRGVSAAAITGALAMGVSAQDIGAWDADDNGALNETEFADGLDDVGLFDQWDINVDTTLDQDEVLQGVFHMCRGIAFGYVSSRRGRKSSKTDHERSERAQKFTLRSPSSRSNFQTR